MESTLGGGGIASAGKIVQEMLYVSRAWTIGIFNLVLPIFSSFSGRDVVVSSIILGVSVKGLHLFRSVRSFVLPLCCLLMICRIFFALDENSKSVGDRNFGFPSFLDIIISMLEEVSANTAFRLIVGDIFGLLVLKTVVDGVHCIFAGPLTISALKSILVDWAYGIVKNTSFVKNALYKEQLKLEAEFDKELKARSRALGPLNQQLPSTGWEPQAILGLMRDATAEEDKIWENGLVSGAVYHGQHKHIQLLNDAFGRYSIANPLHSDIWPSVMKFESEIIAMTAALVSGGNKVVCGCTTSGGTESIILAIKAHRDYYRDNFGIVRPELIACTSAHAAVDKGCDLMGIKLVKIPMDPITYTLDPRAVQSAIGPNTILIYSSAPSYPQGTIDPIAALGQLAVKYKCGLHVDCCLGGFVLPFAKRTGFSVPDFDFTVPGVSSMSLDTHKFGYALKGTSVVLYRSKELRHAQYFCYADWTGGMYSTPTIAGSRSGGLIAQCWASMMAMGMQGYERHTKDIMLVAQQIAKGVQSMPALELCGFPQAMIVCFRSALSTSADGAVKRPINIYSVGDKMSKRGWSLNALQNPACLHICCTVTHVGKHERFLSDLRESVQEVQQLAPGAVDGKAAIYGMTSSLPSGPVNELLKVYNDVVLKC